MAGKYVTVEEAAQMLGISTSEVNDLRERRELNALRDGGTWKFKADDVEKLAQERSGGKSGGGSGVLSGIDFDLPTASSGVGLPSGVLKPAGSDLDLGMGSGSGLNLTSSPSDILFKGDSGALKDSSPSATSDIGVLGTGSGGSGLDLLGSDVQLAPLSGTGSNVLSTGSSGLGDSGKTVLKAELADKGAESSVALSLRDSESVLGDVGSDVTLDVAGSGINLTAPKDSGILLDSLDLAATSGIGKRGSDVGMKTDEDFLLTPMEEHGDESTDSGSQVIALEGDLAEDATATLLAGEVPGLGEALEAGGLGPAGAYPGAGPAMYQPQVPDTVFGVGSVIALAACALLMAVTGIMMFDIMRNMWSWDTPYSFNSSLMDMILSRK